MRAVIGTALLLAACSGGGGDAPGAVTADEDRQLNEAAARLDAAGASPEAPVANGAAGDDPGNAAATTSVNESTP